MKTQTIWELLENTNGFIVAKNGKPIASVLRKDNAEFIFHVLNSHDALLEGAKQAVEVLVKAGYEAGSVVVGLRRIIAKADGQSCEK